MWAPELVARQRRPYSARSLVVFALRGMSCERREVHSVTECHHLGTESVVRVRRLASKFVSSSPLEAIRSSASAGESVGYSGG